MSRAVRRFHRTNASLPSLTGGIAMRIQPIGLIDNQIWLCTFDYLSFTTATPNSAAEVNLAANWATNVATSFRAVLASDIIWNQIKVTCLNIITRQPFTQVGGTGLGNGTVVGSHIPSEMSAVMSKFTAVKGQHGRGRVYLPGVPSSFVAPATDANHITTAAATSYNTFLTALFATLSDGTNTYAPAVTQRTTGGAAATNGGFLKTPATGGMIINLLLGTTRRRRIGRGK